MDNNVVWIVIAALIALVVIGVVVMLALRTRNRRRVQEADRIREEVHHDTKRVERQASLVEETEAKARAAQAEAEAKAAEASRLADAASTRRDALNGAQEHLNARREHADKLDPRSTDDVADDPNRQKDVAAERHYQDTNAEQMRPDVTTR
jgi:biopolymer transport protein ExbB/TolQ